MSIEKVTYLDASTGRRKTVLLTDVYVSEHLLRGIQVDNEGIRLDPSKAYLQKHGGDHGTILHLLDLTLIEARTLMVCDHMYGWLVPDGTATQQKASL